MDITRPRRDAPAIRLTSAGIVAHPNRMVNRINARIIPHRSPPDNFHQHAPQRRPHILIFLRSVVAILLLAICAVAAAAQTGADSSSIRAIQAALQARDNEKALTLVRTQLQAWPKDVRLWALEGIALTQLGRNHEALIAYNKALALSPDYLAALEGAAELEYKAGSIRAVPLLNRILKVRPDEPTTHAMLAALAYKKHDCAAAVEHFQKSAPVLSAQPTALEEYGACLIDLQKPDEAVPVFEQILALLPNGPHARYSPYSIRANRSPMFWTSHQQLTKKPARRLAPLVFCGRPSWRILIK